MYENDLKERFKRIFKLSKVEIDMPGDSLEQDCLFIDIQKSRNSIKNGKETAYVEGRGVIYSQNNQIPMGFFSKQIQLASPNETKDLFFTDFESNSLTMRNLVERSFSFVYLYSGQYDPDHGTLTSIDFKEN